MYHTLNNLHGKTWESVSFLVTLPWMIQPALQAFQPRHKRMNLNALAIVINLLLMGAQVLLERFLWLGSKSNAMHIHSISFDHI